MTEKEINDIVIKKLENIKEVLLNTSKWDYKKSFSFGISGNEIKELLGKSIIKEELSKLIEKEIELILPLSSIEEKEINRKKNVNKTFEFLSAKTRGYNIRIYYDEIDKLIN